MEAVLRETDFKNLGTKTQGKVRDIYEQEQQLILISTDRHSSFDRIIAYIPGKGEVLNRTSAFWFDHTQDIVQNHVLATPDPNVTIGKKCKPLPIEVVMRGYLTGVTSTSLWTHYKQGKRNFGNFTLPEGMKKNERLSEPVFTPSTKEKDHDKTVTPQEVLDMGLLQKDMLEKVAYIARALFARGQALALERGLILVDTKYEMGLDENGELTLIDEIHTPDSSRYWQAASYEARIAQGGEPEYFDKEFLRLWFMEHCDPYKDTVLPPAPKEMVAELSSRYATIFNQLTGENVRALEGVDIQER
ncbi:phosphoribosylaminoimidazolesuccinocarboxamide synthase, partial [Acetobacteraceae bacterium]|nr:phosphoribosylaminoimidazolesuccinocarboxamide synthase [Candidatus Parcubacteria bacterium]